MTLKKPLRNEGLFSFRGMVSGFLKNHPPGKTAEYFTGQKTPVRRVLARAAMSANERKNSFVAVFLTRSRRALWARFCIEQSLTIGKV